MHLLSRIGLTFFQLFRNFTKMDRRSNRYSTDYFCREIRISCLNRNWPKPDRVYYFPPIPKLPTAKQRTGMGGETKRLLRRFALDTSSPFGPSAMHVHHTDHVKQRTTSIYSKIKKKLEKLKAEEIKELPRLD